MARDGKLRRVVAHIVGAEVHCGSRRVSPAPGETSERFEGVGRNNSVAQARCVIAARCLGEVGCTKAQFNSSVVHFIGLRARYLTVGVYRIIEIAWRFLPGEGRSRRRCNQIRCTSCGCVIDQSFRSIETPDRPIIRSSG
jgi:hypothetical protein